MKKLVLSLFPGIDLLGRGFAQEGFCVVRGPDLIFGSSIEEFHPLIDAFEGIIAGSPCQDFSKIRRAPPSGVGDRSLLEFTRTVTEALPEWWLLENVPGVPDVHVCGYTVQRFNLNANECGLAQHRLRRFQFGSRDGLPLVVRRRVTAKVTIAPCCLASEGSSLNRRSWSEFVQLQGLPADFDLPGWSIAMKYRVVGNGVPVPMARVIAASISSRHLNQHSRLCLCQCGRTVQGKATLATPACRKRMERSRRD